MLKVSIDKLYILLKICREKMAKFDILYLNTNALTVVIKPGSHLNFIHGKRKTLANSCDRTKSLFLLI